MSRLEPDMLPFVGQQRMRTKTGSGCLHTGGWLIAQERHFAKPVVKGLGSYFTACIT